jgi:putative flavoprotein involved in K+ transport
VLVVGCGTSATEIATRLAAEGAKRVRVAVRTPPNLMPEHFLGVPITFFARALENAQRWLVDLLSSLPRRVAIGGLSEYGIDRAPFGVGTELRLKGMGPVIDRGFVEAVKAGRLEVVSALEGFDQDAVLLSDGSRIRPQVVIAATGYRPGLEGLVGALGVLGKPSVLGAETHPHAPGLYFCGYRLPLSGELSGMRRDSRQIARAIAGRRRRSRRTGAS